jgi:hypothetical protein
MTSYRGWALSTRPHASTDYRWFAVNGATGAQIGPCVCLPFLLTRIDLAEEA